MEEQVFPRRLEPTLFQQMAGRAGRTGLASRGEVYVLATSRAEVERAHPASWLRQRMHLWMGSARRPLLLDEGLVLGVDLLLVGL